MLITSDRELLSMFELSNLLFTPLHLFFLLNVLIISIILMTHLRKEAPKRRAVTSCGLLSTKSSTDHEVVQRLEGNYAEIHAQSYSAKVIKLELALNRSDGEVNQSDNIEEPNHSKKDTDHGNGGRASPKAIKEVISEENMISENAAAAAAADLDRVGVATQKSSDKWFLTPNQEKPLASTHFLHKKPTNRSHASNSPLKISRPGGARKGDTLDATWKAICDDKLKHSNPFHHHVTSRTRKGDFDTVVDSTYKRKETRVSCLSPSKQRKRMPTASTHGLMRRRELSIPRDDLNARVESFISKFHQQIKIQREQSLLSYSKMVDRGTK